MAAPEWVSVKLDTGMWPDIAPRKSKGFFRTGRHVRFTPQLEVMGGSESALDPSSQNYHGVARKIIEWADNNANQLVAIATNTSVWASSDSVLSHITPVEEYVFLTAQISTVAASPTFTITKTAHGYVAGMLVDFPDGPTIDGVMLTSTYYAIVETTANSFTFTAGSNASAGGSGLGAAIDMRVFLRPGLEFGLVGAGYGTGAYDVGTYGGTAATSYRARLWTGGAIGEMLVANPRGGATYEFVPAFSTADLAERLLDPDFITLTAGWSYGTGWARDAAGGEADAVNVTAGLSLTSALYQPVTLPAGRYLRIKATARKVTGGTLTMKFGSTTLSSAISADGRFIFEFWNTSASAQNLAFHGASNFTGSITKVSIKYADTLCRNTTAPASSLGVHVTPAGHEICFGCTDASTALVDPMLVRSSGRLDTRTWTAAYTNEARSFYLREGSEIRQAVSGKDGVTYFLTDRALWEAQYTGLPDVFSFNMRANNCGAVGARAAGFDGKALWWMSNVKSFKRYAGAEVEDVFSPGRDTVFDNVTSGGGWDLVEAHLHNHGELWWAYPSTLDGDGSYISRYTAHFVVGAEDRWLFGDLKTREAWAPPSNIGYPLAAEDGVLYYEEKGDSSDGVANLNWLARATAIEIGSGNTLGEVSDFIPDHKDMTGPYNVRFYGYAANEASAPEDSGELSVTSGTQYLAQTASFFVQGRIMDIAFSGNATVKIGDPRYLLQDTGNQF